MPTAMIVASPATPVAYPAARQVPPQQIPAAKCAQPWYSEYVVYPSSVGEVMLGPRECVRMSVSVRKATQAQCEQGAHLPAMMMDTIRPNIPKTPAIMIAMRFLMMPFGWTTPKRHSPMPDL